MKRLLVLSVAFLVLTVPSVVLCQELQEPEAGKARVYFFYYFRNMQPRKPSLRFNETVQLFSGRSYLGSVNLNQCYGVDLDPSETLIWAMSANQKWFVRADLEADRTYYLRIRMLMPKAAGIVTPYWAGPARPSLHPASTKTGEGKDILKQINKRLDRQRFIIRQPITADIREQRQKELDPVITEVLAEWDSDWSKYTKWKSLNKDDYAK
jgi:hypothetical protein